MEAANLVAFASSADQMGSCPSNHHLCCCVACWLIVQVLMEVAGETMAQLPAAKARPVSSMHRVAAWSGCRCSGIKFGCLEHAVLYCLGSCC